MDEFTLIKKLESLKSVKADSNWASLSKANIMSQEFEKPSFSFFDYVKQPKLVPVYASFIVLFTVTPFIFAQNALPGEKLYTLKKIEETVRYAFDGDKSAAQIAQVQTRLGELNKITEQSENQGHKLAAGIKETKQALTKASKEIAKAPEAQKAEIAEKIITQITAIEKKTNAAIMDSDKEYQELYKFFVDNEIKEIELRKESLNEEQLELFNQAKELFETENYSEALEMIYQIQPNN
ncbi:MAG: hypothetical protein MCSN_3960 [Candidatus Microsyncoccus archaeolyticus]|jgi:hypothetical protein|nr:MAG: hypothetical protein MCSN_3960 [Candidatus Parcubacteria bacterium]